MSVTINPLAVRVSVDEIRRDLPACLLRVEDGETLVIVKDGKPPAELARYF